MLFRDMLKEVPHLRAEGDLDRDITRIVYDSRLVEPGDLFVALRGESTDGHKYIDQAVQRGAAAILVEEPVHAPSWAMVAETLPALALAASKVYGSPASDLTMIGVTGSNGKTTTTYALESIGATAGRKVGLFGTVEYRWPGSSKPAPHTTPFSSDLQHELLSMKKAGVSEVVMEVSSHALALHRVDTLSFDVAVFTNLSHEHLDFHGSMEGYAASKFRLFSDYLKPEGKAILNLDDCWGKRWARQLPKEQVLTYGLSNAAGLFPETYDLTAKGIEAVLWSPAGRLNFESNLLGRHNLYNLLAAIGASLAAGMTPSQIEEALRTPIQVPGRLEAIVKGQPFQVLVDYAHTPDGLENVLKTLSEIHHRRLLCVVGAGGDRDKAKRPLMASIGYAISDLLILTSDNPRREDPEKILDNMEVGVDADSGKPHLRIVDRREAIARAIMEAKAEDIVLIAGKGHEDYQEIDRVRHPFDDRIEAARALESLGFKGGEA
jgi:UDP-N-acetylmuramoyl-L-alanyl-D-glutamate--2,6-diaminopimelate ligase